MLVHPYLNRVRTIAGTRILEKNLGLSGEKILEKDHPERLWVINGVYSPIKRALGGIRAKVRDQKDFISFVNQRDLEVLLGLGEPGSYCKWLGEEYVAPGDPKWFGVCADEDDLLDDLFDREVSMRATSPAGYLEPGAEIVRFVHLESGVDVQELWTLLCDADPKTGMAPDPRFSTLSSRWIRVERNRVVWKRM